MEIISRDGKQRVMIETVHGTLYKFTEYTDTWQEEFTVQASVWAPTYFSGLYDSEETAKAEALAALPWLRHLISN